jgi:transcriptional regulator with XRE-family HTH domain
MPWHPETLKRLRNKRGLTQVELADRLDVHQVAIARWETGTRRPGVEMLERLAEALGVKITELLK